METVLRLALFFAGGGAFFAGAAVIVVAVVTLVAAKGKVARAAARLALFAAILLVALSAAPLPYWLYAAWTASVAASVFFSGRRPDAPRTSRHLHPAAAVLLTVAAVGYEAALSLAPRLPLAPGARLVVLADSITAGLSDGETTWPQILAARGIPVEDLSAPGLTIPRSSSKAAAIAADTRPKLIIVELGGNDMLNRVPPRVFERDLAALLSTFCGPSVSVLMLELPLPPLHNGYGRAQRRLAARHGVRLLPRRLFARVLATPGATQDGLHLSQAGQRLMAETIYRVIAPLDDN